MSFFSDGINLLGELLRPVKERTVETLGKIPPRQRIIGASVVGGTLVLVLGIWVVARATGPTGASAAGYYFKCTDPNCGKEFTISRTNIRDWPRGAHGEGYQCKRCGKFTAKPEVKCPKCGKWFVPTDPANPRCPFCYPPGTNPPASKRPHGN